MKNAFAFWCLIPLVGYIVALAVETLGVVSLRVPALSTFLGSYVVIGVLALAFRDYSPRSSARSRVSRRAAAPRTQIAFTLRGLSLMNPSFRRN